MSTNCLVTKLKSEVSNDSLGYINSFKFQVSENKAITLVRRKDDDTGETAVAHLKIVGNGVFSDSTFEANLGTELFNNTERTVYVKTSQGCTVHVFDNYSLVAFNGPQNTNLTNIIFDISAFNYRNRLKYIMTDVRTDGSIIGNVTQISDDITQFKLSGSDVVLDTSIFIGKENLTTLGLNRCTNVTGNLTDLYDNDNLNSLMCSSTSITGDLESLFVNILNKGILSTFNVQASQTVTFNERGANNYGALTASFATSSITVTKQLDSSVIGTYDGTSWSYSA